jgi:hypothetical protein
LEIASSLCSLTDQNNAASANHAFDEHVVVVLTLDVIGWQQFAKFSVENKSGIKPGVDGNQKP